MTGLAEKANPHDLRTSLTNLLLETLELADRQVGQVGHMVDADLIGVVFVNEIHRVRHVRVGDEQGAIEDRLSPIKNLPIFLSVPVGDTAFEVGVIVRADELCLRFDSELVTSGTIAQGEPKFRVLGEEVEVRCVLKEVFQAATRVQVAKKGLL